MRSFLGFVLLVVVALTVAAIVVVPIVVRPIVVDAVRAASPFGDQPLNVEVDVSAVGLVTGRIDRVRVTGEDLDADGPLIGRMDLTATGVSTSDRSFGDLTGGLHFIEVPSFDGSMIRIESVVLSGASDEVRAQAVLSATGALALVGSAFADAGIAVESIELIDGGVSLGIFGQRAELAIGVDAGALIFPDVLGGGPMVILEPALDDPWELTGASVSPGGMEIDAVFHADGLLESDGSGG